MKNVLISAAGGSFFPYAYESLRANYNVFLTDQNPQLLEVHPNLPLVILPPIEDNTFASQLLHVIRHHQIDYYIPLIDEELCIARALMSECPSLRVIAPRTDFIKTCLNKSALMESLHILGISHVPSVMASEYCGEPSYPLFLKPNCGRGSRGAHRVTSPLQYEAYFALYPYERSEVLVQSCLEGTEYTVSVTVNSRNQVAAIVPKRVLSKKGVTQQAITEKNSLIDAVCSKIVRLMKPHGPFNVQLMLTQDGIQIFEINPRLSTTAILTCEAGANEFELCIENYDRENLARVDFTEGVCIWRRWESLFYRSSGVLGEE
jgi:carbamoyl-phosphate synthase large subunit